MDAPERHALFSIRNLVRLTVALLVLLVLIEGVPVLLNYLAARRLASLVPRAETGTPSPSPAIAGQVNRGSAGSVRTTLGFGIVLNKNSSLEREWVTVNVAEMPARIVGPAAVEIVYKSGSYSGYNYTAGVEIETKEALSALQVKFLTFDVWGEHVRNLSYSEVEDIPAGHRKVEGNWNVASENEASQHYASIAYVARVRTKAGRVLTADTTGIIEEAKRFSAKFDPSTLESIGAPSPKPTEKP